MAQVIKTSATRELAAVLLGGGGMALAILVLAWQTYMWLKTGHWPYLTMATIAVPLVCGSHFYEWLAAPQSWLGLHSVVKPLFFELPLSGPGSPYAPAAQSSL